jgi:hypothetical protein
MRRLNWRNPRQQILIVIGVTLTLYIYYATQQGFTFRDLLISIYGLFLFRFDVIPESVRAFAFDVVVILAFGSVFWLSFFAQFVLPVRTVGDRFEVVSRVLSILTVGHGPAIFIRNGEKVETPGESQRAGAGVLLLDTASAAVLYKDAGFTRAVGPGLYFTERDEKIADTVDLHMQERRIGPLWEDKDPEEFPDASEDEKKAWTERRLQTRALTRDGVEVVPTISAIFRIKGKPNRSGNPFGFDADSVWRAVAYQAIYPDAPFDAASHQVEWDWLPVQIAADLWREYLRKYTLNQLFEFTSSRSEELTNNTFEQKTVFERIVQEVNNRMKESLVNEFDEFGNKTGKQYTSREHMLLLERGLQIEKVAITNLRFKKDPVENRLLDRWKNTWLERAKEQQRHIEEIQQLVQEQGRMDAQREFTTMVSRPLYRTLLRNKADADFYKLNLNESLDLLVRGSLEYLRVDAERAKELIDIDEELVSIQDWLRGMRNGR